MAIYRSSDSLSRCDPGLYSNIYDVRKRVDVKQEPVSATQPIHKDTIEISKDKLKEEALECLRHTSKYVIAQDNFIRIGKYLFLAIAFPPYFAIYGLPKWILVEGLPTIYSMCIWMWKKVQNPIRKHIESGTQKIIQATQFVQKLAQVLMQPFVHLALEIRQSIRRMREHALQFLRNKIKKLLILGRPRLKLKTKIKQRLQARLLQIKGKCSRQVQKINLRMQKGIQWVKDSPKKISEWGHVKFQEVSQRANSLYIQWKNHFQNSQELAQRATNWIVKELKKGGENFKKSFFPFVNFCQQQLQPRWQKITGICKGRWLKAREFCQQKHQRALAFLNAKQEKLKSLSSNRFTRYILSHPWMGKFPLFLQKWLRKILSHPYPQAICHKGVKLYVFFAKCFLQATSLCLQIFSQGVNFIIKTSDLLRTILITSAQNIFAVLKVGQKILRKCMLYVLYYFLLFVVISSILFIWSLHYLRNHMNSLTALFSLKNRFAKFKG